MKHGIQRDLILDMMGYLTKVSEEAVNTNAQSRINDDLDYVTVKYLGLPPDGDRQHKYAEEQPIKIDFDYALMLLYNRIINTLS